MNTATNLAFRRRYRTNYRLKAGDRVVVQEPAVVDGYVYDPEHAPFGGWHRATVLPGAEGVVVTARTPCTMVPRGINVAYFANVDVLSAGEVLRIRVPHTCIRRSRRKP